MNKDFFKGNRLELINKLNPRSACVLFAGSSKHCSSDEDFPFVCNKNFYYECGLNEANLIIVLENISNEAKTYAFINPYDERYAKWIGKTLTKEEVREISAIDEVMYLEEFEDFMNSLLTKIDYLYLDLEKVGSELDVTRALNYAKRLEKTNPKYQILDVYELIVTSRMVKKPEEIELLRKAIEITSKGIDLMYKNAKVGMKEYQLEAYFDFEIKKEGASGHAFKTIAGSGKNATVLHYSENNSLMNDGDLILFDLGAKYEMYNADISRTFPVNGKFTKRQKELYEIVLNGQKLIINNVRAGLTLRELNDMLCDYYKVELKKAGVIKNDEELVNYYFHGVSHHLGLDTHDASIRSKPLEVGNVITVEPGVYIPEENIGIRIENDVLVTENGCIDLCENVIREVSEIEEMMK